MNYDLDTKEGLENSKLWLLELLKTIRQGGTWIVPRSNMTIHIDHAYQTATVTKPHLPDNGVRSVFEAIDWKFRPYNPLYDTALKEQPWT